MGRPRPGTAVERRAAVAARVGRTQPRWARVLVYAVLVLFALIYIYPFLIQLATRVQDRRRRDDDPLSLWPQTGPPRPSTGSPSVGLSRAGSRTRFVVALCVTLGRVFFDSLAGYALARLHFRGRTRCSRAFIAVMAVPGVVLLIPKFLVLNQLGAVQLLLRA